MQFKANKVIYRRYAGLYFSLCVDVTDNELAYLESIHLFVEILDHYFSNVCELDLVFNFHKVILAASLCLLEALSTSVWCPPAVDLSPTGFRLQPLLVCCCQCSISPNSLPDYHMLICTLTVQSCPGQVYLILDEFIMGGEIQETSKKVHPRPSMSMYPSLQDSRRKRAVSLFLSLRIIPGK